MTLQEIADAVGVSRQTLSRYKAQGCPLDSPAAVRAWRENNRLPRKGIELGPGETYQARLLQAQIAKTEQEARWKRLRNDQLAGRLVDRDEIIREFAEFLACAKPILDALPDDIATESPHEFRPKFRAIAKAAVDRALRKLSQWEPSGQPTVDETDNEDESP